MLTANLVHVGYVLMLFALLARDILWLRAVLVFSQSLLCVYALYKSVPAIAAWNALFVIINTVWVILILRERRAVRLPEELRPIHEKHFAALSPPEFLRLWSWSELRHADGEQLVRQGERPQHLYFLLTGAASVQQQGREIARVGAGHFIAEMSLLTGELTVADVVATGPTEFRVWPVSRLQQLRQRNPMLWSRIQSVLGHDMVEKLKIASAAH